MELNTHDGRNRGCPQSGQRGRAREEGGVTAIAACLSDGERETMSIRTTEYAIAA